MSRASELERRFVLLRHTTASDVHFDLMIDCGEVLATWRLPCIPTAGAAAELPLERIGDHRRVYLEYEGPLSGDRGMVAREDAGTVNVLRAEASVWEVEFAGQRVRGRYLLVGTGEGQRWLLRPV